MKCADFERNGEAWLSGAAPAEFEAHLRACERCRTAAEEIAGTRSLLGLLRAEAPEPSATFWARLEVGLREADRKNESWTVLALSARRVAAALATVALALALWIWTHPAAPAAAFDAPETYLQDDSTLPGPGVSGQLDRDQVLLTLVARQGEKR